MIAVLVDRKGFVKSVEIAYPRPDIRIELFHQPVFYPEPEDKNIFDRQLIQTTQVVFYRKKELYAQVWLYEER